MGQNIPESIEPNSKLTQNWLPHGHEHNVLIHKITQEQVQRHIIKILIKDLPREIAHFASRMSNHQPQICRLLYFHPTVPDPRMSHDQREFREMHLYTDKMLSLKYWNKEKMIPALHGLKKLVSVHGPIKISEGMICENENGEVKVWISQNPVNNHPDSKYMSQEQTVANLGSILAKKNKQLAGLLFGCNTLKDALQKISKTKKDFPQGFNNYSHKIQESGDVQGKKVDFIQKAPNFTQYRNVFGEKGEVKNINHKQLFKNPMKKPQEDHKPGSHLSYAPKAAEPYVVTYQGRTIEESSGNKKSIYETNSDIKKLKVKEDCANHKSVTNLHFTTIHRSISKNEPNHRNTFEGRPTNLEKFQNNRFSKNEDNFPSQKGLKNNSWQPYEPTTTFGMPNRRETTNHETTFGNSNNTSSKNSKTPNKGQKQDSKPYDITIINNNVSNYINTVVHNHSHVHKLGKKGSLGNPCSNAEEEKQGNDPLHSSHKPFETGVKEDLSGSNQKGKEKPHFIPIFIQQKKRVNTNIKSNSPPEKYCNSGDFLSRQDTMKSQNTNLSSLIESPSINVILEKKERKVSSPGNYAPRVFQRKSEKVYTFSRRNQPNSSLHKYYNPIQTQKSEFYPQTLQTPLDTVQQQSFSKYERNIQSRPFKGQLRTKTTDFYPKNPVRQQVGKKMPKQSLPFMENELQIGIRINPVDQESRKSNPSARQNIQKSQQHEQGYRRSRTPEQRSNLKKQIKKEFSFLLGGDSPKANLQAEEKSPKLMKRSEIVEIKRSNEDVNEKIAKKQIQFAELKKMAQELLI